MKWNSTSSKMPKITPCSTWCNNWFNFYPVGQGLFYAGTLSDGGFSFVFDCGTETAGINIKNYLTHLETHALNKELDFVVISHLHNDHYSGMQDLLDSFSVRRIIAPYICEDVPIREAIYASLFFLSMEGEESLITRRVLSFLDDLAAKGQGNDWQKGKDGCFSFEINNPAWKFIFIAKAIKDFERDQFRNEYNQLLSKTGDSSVRELIENGHLRELSEVYKSVFGTGNMLNETSVVMLHYPLLANPSHCNIQASPYSSYPFTTRYVSPTALLTGDAMIDNAVASAINSHVVADIGIIQVPHHGSYKNWKAFKTLVKNRNSIYLIPCGTHNGHGHPSNGTLSELNGSEYHLVTEFSGYPYWIRTLQPENY